MGDSHRAMPPATDLDLDRYHQLLEAVEQTGEGQIAVTVGNPGGVTADLTGYTPAGWRVIETDQVTAAETVSAGLGGSMTALAGAAAGLQHPLLSLVVAAGDVGRSLLSTWLKKQRPEEGQVVDSVELLNDLMMQISAGHPTVFALDRLPPADGRRVIQRMAQMRRNHMLLDSPIVLLLTLGDGPETLAEDKHARTWPEDVAAAGERAAAGDIEWWFRGQLDLAQVERWLGAIDSDLAAGLISLSGGSDEAASSVWNRWRRTGYAEHADGRWHARGPEALANEVLKVLDARISDPARRDIALDALTWGSFAGDSFPGDAVATLVAGDDQQDGPVGVDEVIDLLDDLVDTETGIPYLLVSDGNLEIRNAGGIRWIWRYRFADPLVAGYLRHRPLARRADLDEEEHNDRLNKLLDVLLGLPELGGHSPQDLAGLARRCKRPDLAESMEMRARSESTLAQLQVEAASLLALAPGMGAWGALTEPLAQLSFNLSRAGIGRLAVRCGEAAVKRASLEQAPTSLAATAALRLGSARSQIGRPDDALPPLRDAVRLFSHLEEESPTAMHRRYLAVALTELGSATRSAEGPETALPYLRRAERLAAQLATVQATSSFARGHAIALIDLGQATDEAIGTTAALPYFRRAEVICAKLATDHPWPTYLGTHAVALRHLGNAVRSVEGPTGALPYLVRAERIYELLATEDLSPRIKRGHGLACLELGRVTQGAIDAAAALPHIHRAVAVFTELAENHPSPRGQRDLADALILLGSSIRDVQGAEAALDYFARAEALWAQLAATYPTYAYRRGHAVSLYAVALATKKARGPSFALPVFVQVEALQAQLAADHPTPTHQRDHAMTLADLRACELEASGP